MVGHLSVIWTEKWPSPIWLWLGLANSSMESSRSANCARRVSATTPCVAGCERDDCIEFIEAFTLWATRLFPMARDGWLQCWPARDERRDRTRSDLERDFLRLCRRHRLPAPEVNVRIGPHLVDFLWRARWLVVETDFYGFHRGRVAFQDDRGRDLDLRRLGFAVIRLSEKQVDEEPERVAEVLHAALADHGAP